MSDDHIWDEDRWESFLRENDRRVERFMDYLFHFLKDNPAPDESDPEALTRWEAKLEDYMSRKMGWNRGVDRMPFWLPDEDDDPDDGLEDVARETDDVQQIPVYQNAHALTQQVLAWSESIPGETKDSSLVQFCTFAMQIGAYIVRGHSLGYERETIGGNIASVKRSLHAANAALDLLKEMQDAPYLSPAVYRKLYERVFEVRNEIGLYVQELRERFELGID